MENYTKYNFKEKNLFVKKRYLLISEIGMGSFSIVYLAYDLKNKMYCAVKIFDFDSMMEGKLENKLYNKCNHKNIIKTIDTFIIDYVNKNVLYKYYTLVFPLKNNNIRYINKKIFYGWIKDILYSIRYLHNEIKICHTDIKPENFVLNNIPNAHLSIIEDYNTYVYLYDNIKFSNIEKTHLHILNTIYYTITPLNDFNSRSSQSSSDSRSSQSSRSSRSSSDSSKNNKNKLILIDLGSSQKISKINKLRYKYKLVQTRYYRSPEIILGLPYSEKIDVWSIGCSLYELYTGKILFNPRNSDLYKTDHHHLFIISKVCGKIPNNMISNSPKKGLLFNIDGSIKYSLLFPNFILNLEDKIKEKKVLKLIKLCLIIDPQKRPSINQLLNMTNII